MRYFSTFETAKLAGVTYDCLKDWLLRGFIKADHTESVGAKDRISKYWTEEEILKIRKFKDLVNMGLSRSLASRIVYGAMDRLKSEYFTIVISTRQTALPSTGPERLDRDADESIADKILYAVTHDPDGLVELSVFEAGRAASVTLSPPMAAQLVKILTSDAVRQELDQLPDAGTRRDG